MKKTLSLIALSAVLLSLFSCASVPKLEITPDLGPVAIMSISCNEQVIWEDEKTKNVGLGTFIAKRAINANVESEDALNSMGYVKPMIPKMIKDCYSTFENELNLEVIPEEKLFALDEYANCKELEVLKLSDIYPNGYKALDYKNDVSPVVAEKLGAKSFVYINFFIAKAMQNGIGKNGSAQGAVTCSIIFADETGKVLGSFHGYARSEDTVASVLGNTDNAKINAMLPPVIEEALKNAFAK